MLSQKRTTQILESQKPTFKLLNFQQASHLDEETVMTTEVGYEAPTWNQIYNLLLKQAERICRSGFKPDIIVGVSRGGWLPARVLSDLLENPNLANVKAENYTGIGAARSKPTLTQRVSANVAGKRVLIVDEVADTGGSLKLVREHVLEQGALEARTATLYYKIQSTFKPDFYEKETGRWIVFPWETKETVRHIFETHKHSDASLKKEDAKLVNAGLPKRLIERFLKEFSEAKKC